MFYSDLPHTASPVFDPAHLFRRLRRAKLYRLWVAHMSANLLPADET